ncbi:MAG: DUF4339 domain-containing protein, partial [Sedimentisphaerales bacterium]|nr:DUF4339 domain-containing protein [Sedimentisphaerales bacterium]
MSEDAPVWYLPGDDNQPQGPYDTVTVLEGLQDGRLAPDALCWKEGMSDWQPLGETDPFRQELEAARRAGRRRARRMALGVVVVLALAGGAVAAYFVLRDPPEVAQGKKLMAAGLHEQAAQTLRAYVKSNPLDEEATYLLAMARIREFAESDTDRFWNASGALQEAEQELGRLFRTDTKWLEKARSDVSAALSGLPSGTPAGQMQSLEGARFQARLKLADEKQLAAELLRSLEQSSNPSDVLRAGELATQILDWDPSLADRVVAQVLPTGKVSGLGLSSVLNLLSRWAAERPEVAKGVSAELLKRAESLLGSGGGEQAKQFLRKALEFNRDALQTQEHALLYIRLMDPDDTKLTQCQLFLSKYPESPHLADVHRIVVTDAATVFDRYGRWNRSQSQSYLAAGLASAGTLIEKWPRTNELDVRVYELAKRLARDNQYDAALDVTEDLLAATPQSPVRIQIENDRAQWRVQVGLGTLPAELDTLARQLDEDLSIKDLTMPAAVRTLAESPELVHVIRVTDGCTANKFNSEEIEMLRRWVAGGGILWANNDVLSLFDIKYTVGYWLAGAKECVPAVPQESCPVVSGCQRIVASKGHPAASNLNHPRVIPLLTTAYREERYAYWSLVPYGDGWVSDAKTVDTAKHDGARFWLNFRLFCLGREIPGAPDYVAPSVPEAPGRPTLPQGERRASPPAPSDALQQRPTRITSLEALKSALSSAQTHGILWVALPRADTDDEARDALQRWVHRGGVLWVETDLASLFGFGSLRRDASLALIGSARVAS